MPTNHYFNFYGSKPEQRLVEDLMVEAIKQYGFDGYYIHNSNDAARDLLHGDDPLKKFQAAYPVELYFSNATGYDGEQEFFSKFGLDFNFFWHQKDDFTITSQGFIWCFPGRVLDGKAIAVLPETWETEMGLNAIKKVHGI